MAGDRETPTYSAFSPLSFYGRWQSRNLAKCLSYSHTATGWRKQRKIVTQDFHRTKVAQYYLLQRRSSKLVLV